MPRIQRRKSLQDPPLVAPPTMKSPHVKVVYIRRSLAMTPEQWEAWDWKAKKTGALARGGPRRGKSSWRRMAAQIADEALEEMQAEKELEARKAIIKQEMESHKTPITRSGDMRA